MEFLRTTPDSMEIIISKMNFGWSARMPRAGRPARPRRLLHLTEGAMGFLDVSEYTPTIEASRAVTDFSWAVLEDSRPAPTLASASRGEPKSALKMADRVFPRAADEPRTDSTAAPVGSRPGHSGLLACLMGQLCRF